MTVLTFLVKLIVAGGLLNVWILRNSKSTDYRGGQAQNLMEEFEVYGLPKIVYYLVGFLKISSSLGLILSLWWPLLRLPCVVLIIFLMLGAVLMHWKVSGPTPPLSVYNDPFFFDTGRIFW